MLNRDYQFEGYTGTIVTNTNCILKCSYCYEDKPMSIDDDKKFWESTKHRDEKRSYALPKTQDCCNTVISLETAKKFIDQFLEFENSDFSKNMRS